MAMMDWYYGLETEDLIVPRDEESLNMFASPTSWLNWEIDGSEIFGWMDGFNTGAAADQPVDEKRLQKSLFGEVNRDCSLQYSEHSNTPSISSGGSENTSWQMNPTVHSRPDFQFNDLMGDVDDIFLSSLLKDDLAATKHNDDSFGLYSESQSSCLMPVDSNSSNMKSGESITGQVPSFSPNNITNVDPHDHPSVKALESKVLDTTDEISVNGHTGREVLLEDTVLQELELALSQLPEKTRLCIRDSLYRLAHNSSQQMPKKSHNEGPVLCKNNSKGTPDEKTRSGKEADTTKSKTNTIDRAVANLMFNKVDLNTQDFVTAMSASSKHERIGEGSQYCSFSPPEILHHRHMPIFFLNDPLVPVFTRQKT